MEVIEGGKKTRTVMETIVGCPYGVERYLWVAEASTGDGTLILTSADGKRGKVYAPGEWKTCHFQDIEVPDE